MLENIVSTETALKTIICKFCGSSSVVRYGFTQKGRQRHYCLNCNRTFIDNDAPERMRYTTEVISSALNHFYEGRSLHEIKRLLEMDFDVLPDPSSIYDWIFNYTKKAIDTLESVKPRTGQTWLAGETTLKLKSINCNTVRILDCIDEKSGFLVVSHIMRNTAANADAFADAFMEAIYRRMGGQNPKTLIIDDFKTNPDTFKQDRLVNAGHRPGYPNIIKKSTTGIKQLHRTVKSRTKILRSLTSQESADLIINGWSIHYNFFRPHPGLNGITPAIAAGLDLPFNRWADIIGENHRRKVEFAGTDETKPGIEFNWGTYIGMTLMK
jgi:putative transposase